MKNSKSINKNRKMESIKKGLFQVKLSSPIPGKNYPALFQGKTIQPYSGWNYPTLFQVNYPALFQVKLSSPISDITIQLYSR